MALKDALKTPPKSRRMNVIETWRDKLDVETRTLFDAAVRDPEWTTAALLRVVRDDGFELTHQTLARYRDRVLRGVIA